MRILKFYQFLLIIISLGFLGLAELAVADIVIIANTKNPASNLSLDTVKRLYLGKLVKIPGTPIVAIPLDQSQYSEIRADFNNSVIQMKPSDLMQYWSKRIFTGKGGPPIVVKNSGEVIEAITNNVNAIGYVHGSEVTSQVKVLARV